MRKFRWLLLLPVLLAGCQGGSTRPEGAGKIVRKSADVMPDWVVNQFKSEDGTYIYFVGIAEKVSGMKTSREEARNDCIIQLAEFLGMQVSTSIKSKKEWNDTNEASSYLESIKQSMEGKSSSEISIKQLGAYWEEYSDGSYNMYILVSSEKKWVEKERERLKKLAEAQREAIRKYLQAAEKALNEGNIAEALDQATQAYFISAQSSKNADLYEESKNLVITLFSSLSYKLESTPKYAYIQGGSDPIDVSVHSSKTGKPVSGIKTAGIGFDKCFVNSDSGNTTDNEGKVFYKVANIKPPTPAKLRVAVTFSIEKLDKAKDIDEEFFEKLRQLQRTSGVVVDLEVSAKVMATPTAVVFIFMVDDPKDSRFTPPRILPNVQEELASRLANKGFNIISVEVPETVFNTLKEEAGIRDAIISHLKDKYPTTKRLMLGTEVMYIAGKNEFDPDMYWVRGKLNLSLIEVDTAGLVNGFSVDAKQASISKDLEQAKKDAILRTERALMKKMGEKFQEFKFN